MRDYSKANKHGLNYPEARSFLLFAAGEAEWEGDDLLAERLRIQAAYYIAPYPEADGEYAVQCTSPHFDNKYWQEWRHKNGETAWEYMARRRKNINKALQKEFHQQAGC